LLTRRHCVIRRLTLISVSSRHVAT
jgi:hypothetical protein